MIAAFGAIASLPLAPPDAAAHGYAGKRIFPTTFEVDDPFVMDEFSLLGSYLREAGTAEVPALLGTGVAPDYTARISGLWGVTLGGEFRRVEPDGGDAFHGFGNALVGTKYQFFTNHEHEAIASIGVDASIGSSGDPRVGADPVTVLFPTLFFGKGLGDLPESAGYLWPLAVTGAFGGAFPVSGSAVRPDSGTGVRSNRNPTRLNWGITIQYSIPYLQAYVEDQGWPAPFDYLIPVVELAAESCLNAACGGETNGTVNPGLIGFGDYIQLGAAAQIPINRRTGSDIGVLALFHLFVDDLLDDHHHPHEHDSPQLRLPLSAAGREAAH
ncbi:hypothetical protein ACW73L_12035 [Methylolobus aquaticus]